LLEESRKEFTSEEAFGRRLRALGLTKEEFNQRAYDQALADAVLERELKSKLTIADAQVQDFYQTGTDILVKVLEATVDKLAKNPDTRLDQLADAKKQLDEFRKANLERLHSPERVRLIHVFLATRNRNNDEELPEPQRRAKRQLIEQIQQKAKTGEDFAKLVLQYSEDVNLKDTKGEYTLARRDPFLPEFKAAAFSLPINQISDVVTTAYGLHVIKVLEKIPAKKLEFDKAAPGIKEFLLSQELQKQMPAYFEKVKQAAGVEILDPKLKLELPPDTGSASTGK
jgi:parvulin-like peptidyl-prolyl isomerase